MKKYNTIDIFKFIMAIFVIAIHTNLMNTDQYPLYSLLVKCAVPYYFMCTGFLLMNKIKKEKSELFIIKKYIYKIIKLYIIWSIIYLPITIYSFINTPHNHNLILSIIITIMKYFTIGEQYFSWPLWYLLAIIYSLMVLYFLNRFKLNRKIIFLISIVLFIIGYIYDYMIINIEMFNGTILSILNILKSIIGNSGRILQGLFYIYLGMLLYDKQKNINKKNIYIFLSEIIILIILNCVINNPIFKIPFNILVFIISIKIDLPNNSFSLYFRKFGVYMYFTHMIFYFIYSLFVGFEKNKGINGFIITLICSISLSFLITIINKDKNNKFLNTIFN